MFPFNWDPQRVGTYQCIISKGQTDVFPFNWDPQRVGTVVVRCIGVAVFEFPFNWDPQRVGTVYIAKRYMIVIVFPFNWDPQRVGTRNSPLFLSRRRSVSIQLGSPASGDISHHYGFTSLGWSSFHSIGIPSEWGPSGLRSRHPSLGVSIQLGSPASGDSYERRWWSCT